MHFRLDELAAALNGRLLDAGAGDVSCDGVTTDSRSTHAGALFVPLKGERNGHEYISDAVENGARGYLCSESIGSGPAIVVDDTAAALMAIGSLARQRLETTAGGRIVGITGSVGKTSVKDLVAAALRAYFTHVAANERSFNNEIGLPLALANAHQESQAVVVEMGMRGFGQIARLCEIAHPHVGVITNIGVAHGEFVGGPVGIAKAKGELLEALPHNGFAVLPAGDQYFDTLRNRSVAPVVSFGVGVGDVRVGSVTLDAELHPSFVVDTPWGSVNVRLEARGAHMAINAAAALAVAGVLGVPIDIAGHGLSGASMSPWRMEVHRLPGGALLINDSYNANPVSMAAALRSLAEAPGSRKIAVVGVMAELGENEIESHIEMAELAESMGIELIPVDCDWYGIAPTSDPMRAIGVLDGDAAVLVKASRSAGLDRFARQLLEL